MTVEEELVISKHAHLRKVDNDPVNIARRALKSLEINPLPDQKTERIIKELESMPRAPHDDTQDAMAFSIPSTAGILGAISAFFTTNEGHAVFHPDSPFVSLEAHTPVNEEIFHVEMPVQGRSRNVL